MNKISCSVEILTFNNSSTLRRCLESVKDFDEIIIIDGGSTDDTIDIAKEYGCVVIEQGKKFQNKDGSVKNFGGIRNQGLFKSAHDWFLFVDSDEYLSNDVISEIEYIIGKNKKPCVYWVPRKYVLGNDVIDCSISYPSKQPRFFNKQAIDGFIKEVHERISIKEGYEYKDLKNYMMVPLLTNIADMRKKSNNYIKLELKRKEDITFLVWIKILFIHIKISILYIFRFFRGILFCRGKHMPVVYELERFRYNFKLSVELLRKIKF